MWIVSVWRASRDRDNLHGKQLVTFRRSTGLEKQGGPDQHVGQDFYFKTDDKRTTWDMYPNPNFRVESKQDFCDIA